MEKIKLEKERRKDIRLGMFEPFFIRIYVARHKGLFRLRPKRYASTKNISANGMLVELFALNKNQIERIISGKDKLILELDIPFLKKPLRIFGKIVWLEKRDRRGRTISVAGVSFQEIKEKDRERLLPLLISLCLKGKAIF